VEDSNRDERRALVAVDERLGFGDPVREHRCLKRKVRHLERVLKGQVGRTRSARRAPTSRRRRGFVVGVVVREDVHRLRVLTHDAIGDLPDPLSNAVDRKDPELAVRELLDQDR